MTNIKHKYFFLACVICSFFLIEKGNATKCGGYFGCVIKGKNDVVGTIHYTQWPEYVSCIPERGTCDPKIKNENYEGKCRGEQCSYENLCEQAFPAGCAKGKCRGTVICQTLH